MKQPHYEYIQGDTFFIGSKPWFIYYRSDNPLFGSDRIDYFNAIREQAEKASRNLHLKLFGEVTYYLMEIPK
jgi:hypothetical protein